MVLEVTSRNDKSLLKQSTFRNSRNRHTKENESHVNITRSCAFPIKIRVLEKWEKAVGGYREENQTETEDLGLASTVGFSNCLHSMDFRLVMYWPTSSLGIPEFHQSLIGSTTAKDHLCSTKQGRTLPSATQRNRQSEEAKSTRHHLNYLPLPTTNCSYADTHWTDLQDHRKPYKKLGSSVHYMGNNSHRALSPFYI